MKKQESYLPDIHRLLPQSVDAEKALIGSAMLNPGDVLSESQERGVTTDHFHIPANGIIWQGLLDMQEGGIAIDLITLTDFLRRNKKLEEAGGVARVSELLTFVPTSANAAFYSEIICEKYILRRIIKTGTEFTARAYDEPDRCPLLLDEFESAVLAINQTVDHGDEQSTREMVMDAVEAIQTICDKEGELTGLATGFGHLDQMTRGFQNSDMIVIAARPSMGKTALAMNIAEHVACVGNKPVGVFTFEMTKQQLMQRLLCAKARVNLHQMAQGFLKDADFRNLTFAAGKLAEAQILMKDTTGKPFSYYAAVARRWKRKHGIALLVIDYIQLMNGSKRYGGGERTQEIAEVSRSIKNLAKELDIPIIVLAQLNRNAEGRKGEAYGKPRMSDLKESGAIEQDADFVGLLHRPEYYEDDEEAKKEVEGIADLIIAKQRSGPVGTVKLTFLKEFTRFEDRAIEAEPEDQKLI